MWQNYMIDLLKETERFGAKLLKTRMTPNDHVTKDYSHYLMILKGIENL